MAVSFRQLDKLGVITLDHPPANSYDLAFMREFASSVDEAIASDVGAVIVCSASDRFFSGGADIKKFLEGDTEQNLEMIRTSQRAFARMAESSAVFIAHIAGHAMGGGLEIALACDLRYATEGRYRMGTPEVTLGLLPGNGGTQRLARLLGPSRALELLLTGRSISVTEAADLGIVSAVFPAEEAEAKVREIGNGFATGPRLAQAHIKRCVYEGLQLSLAEGLALESRLVAELFDSGDGREGLEAFAQKRRPVFTGA